MPGSKGWHGGITHGTLTSYGYFRCRCEVCVRAQRAYDRRYYHQNKEQHRRHEIKRKYGISHEDYEALYEAQEGVCAMCGDPPKMRRLNIDHDHATGLVRGLLCNSCNARLGWLERHATIIRNYLGETEWRKL